MKPNSCLFLAAQRLCQHQFNVDIESKRHIFDSFNDGKGVDFNDVVPCLNQALREFNIRVKSVHGNISDFAYPELLISGNQWVDGPLIGYVVENQHAVAIIGNETMKGNAAIVLEKVA